MAMNVSLVGSGTVTLVLAHGYGGSQSVWDAVVPQLSHRYQLLLFDWSFSGAVSPPQAFDSNCSFEVFADDLISLLDDMELKSVVFVGHSMSGMIGCIASVKRPELFRCLVLVATSPRYLNSEDYKGGLDLSSIESLLTSIQFNFHAWSEGFATVAMATEDPIPLQKFLANIRGMNPEAALALGKIIFYSDQRLLLQKVAVPCTIIQGANDFVVPVDVAYYMQSKIKGGASVEILEINGHFPQITSSKKFIEIIDRTISGV